MNRRKQAIDKTTDILAHLQFVQNEYSETSARHAFIGIIIKDLVEVLNYLQKG